VNGYWRWEDGGPYYGVPTANFVAWWVVGALAAAVLSGLAARAGQGAAAVTSTRAGLADRALPHIPALLYALSTVMFTAVNLAYGYGLAGLVGLLALALLAWKARGVAAGRTSD
jgi:putative membrane protein